MNHNPIRIEVWSDVVCPFCYIGHQQLSNALATLPEGSDYQIEWKGYLLNPNFQKKEGEDLVQHLARTKGQTLTWAEEATTHVTSFAANEGLSFKLENTIPADSRLAHCLLQLAKQTGQDHEIYVRLFKAYFEEGLAIDDESVLREIALSFNLDWNKVIEQKDFYQSQLAKDIQEAKLLGVQGVPFMVINRKWGISGARGSETMKKALLQALEEM